MYLSRDEDRILCLWKNKPHKDTECGKWYEEFAVSPICYLDKNTFQEVQWTDEEPTEVELIKVEHNKNK